MQQNIQTLPCRNWLASMAFVALALTGCASAPTPPAKTAAPAAPAVPPPAADTAELQAGLEQWAAGFSATARAAGIDEATLHAAFDNLRYLPQVVELDRAQPEFTRSVWDYLDVAVSPRRIALGRDKLIEFRSQADAAAARYGVPPAILVAIWGIESNYGGNYGSIPTIDALATLAFEGRREAWARAQLLDALKILQSGDIARADMIGSWAGAMGQTQFLPSNFLAYAVDANGDGRRDIWGNMSDVMASTANFLARSGWQAGQPWGFEVSLPQGFDFENADPQVRQSTEHWAAQGVRKADGAALPDGFNASILLPAGAKGPAFLVGANFRVILRYNNSTSYALAVGLLAQQLAGGPGVRAPWPSDLRTLTRSELLSLQAALNDAGFDSGKPDGLMGPATRGAVRRFQISIGQPADGFPTPALLDRLLAR